MQIFPFSSLRLCVSTQRRSVLKRIQWVSSLIFLLSLPTHAANQEQVPTAQAILAGGCFWCMEKDFESLPGVLDVVSGFTGGHAPNPTYRGDHSGHYEAVLVTYDRQALSYRDILEHFWVNIDPFDAKGQFCDKGPSYLSAIFVQNEAEQQVAQATKDKVIARFPELTVVTPILPAATFYPIKGAEIGHQDYYKKNPLRYKAYRWQCGRDQRLSEIWADSDGKKVF